MDDGSIRMTMQLESKKIDGHRRVVIPAPGADRMKQQFLLRAIRNGQRWMEMLINGEAKNITDLAAGEILPFFLHVINSSAGHIYKA